MEIFVAFIGGVCVGIGVVFAFARNNDWLMKAIVGHGAGKLRDAADKMEGK